MGSHVRYGLVAGAAAGAAGTTALNVVTYLDMAWRGRPASSTPEQSAELLAEKAGITIPGEGEERDNRLAGLGPLLGVATGVGVGALTGAVLGGLRWRPPVPVLSVALGTAAMAGGDTPMALLGVTDPSSWTPADWASDIVPHLAFGAVTAAVLSALLPRRPSRRRWAAACRPTGWLGRPRRVRRRLRRLPRPRARRPCRGWRR